MKGPVASTTPSGLPAWGPRSARGSVTACVLSRHQLENDPMQKLIFKLPLAALVLSSATIISFAQNQTKRNDRPQPANSTSTQREENKKPADPTRYSYEFTQPEFVIRHILIEHDALGRGKITFERRGEDTPIVEPIELSTGALGRIFGLWTGLGFLDSNENYQSPKNFAHLGTYRLHLDDGKRQRTAEFNWS